MKPTTSFAIKANIAAIILFFLITVVLGIVVLSVGSNIMSDRITSAVLSIVIVSVSFFLTLKLMLKNSKFSEADKHDALMQTWYVYLIFTVVFEIFSFNDMVAQFGIVYHILTLVAQIAAVYGAVMIMENIKRKSKI